MSTWPTNRLDSGVAVVRPNGRLNARSAPRLGEQLHDLIRTGSHQVVVDLSDVTAIDSAILGTLLTGHKAARATSGDLRLVGPNDQVRMVLEITGLDRVLKSYDSVDDAFDQIGS